jgi:integrase
VLERARSCGKVKSIYVIHNLHGQPYSAHGLSTAWVRAAKRVGVRDATLKDLRAKALTDAKKKGYRMEQLQIAAAHTDTQMTEEYIKSREVPVSEVVLDLPKRPEK